MGLISLLFGFKGRINRTQFMFATAGVSTVAGVGFLMLFVMAMSSALTQGVVTAFLGAALYALPLLLAFLWSSWALYVKRLHDCGRSGALLFAPTPFTAFALNAMTPHLIAQDDITTVMAAGEPWISIAGLINFGILLYLSVCPSRAGPNKFGDAPGAPAKTQRTSAQERAEAAAANALVSAQTAIDRAIADHARVMPAQAAARAPAPAPRATLTPAPAAGAPASFGKRLR